MKKIICYLFFVVLMINTVFLKAAEGKYLSVEDLQCNNMINPEGIHSPSLSWKIKSDNEGISQTAWEIQISSDKKLLNENRADIWRSGKQLSDKQFNIKPKVDLKTDAKIYYWRVRIWDNKGEVSQWSKIAHFSTGLLNELSWEGKWITYNKDQLESLPYFRKVYNLDKNTSSPKRAMVFLSGLGSSEFYMNDKLVDPTRYLDPAITNYNKYAFYTTYVVTDFLVDGNNCFGIMLADGWFNQKDAWQGANFSYGKPMLRFQLVVDYADGTRAIFGSDETWRWHGSPVTKSNLYLGETYDARMEISEWCNPDFADENWENAIVTTKNLPPHTLPQTIEPIRKKEKISAEKIWKDKDGNWIFDFGINISGIPSLKLINHPKGSTVTIRIAEEVDSLGSLDFNSLGWIHHDGLPIYSYTSKGNTKQSWEPRFTYSGFRYAELSGFKGVPDTSTLKLTVVYSDVATTGTFTCSDSQINILHQLALNTVLSNLHGIPTDCPNREKCGWLGDTHAYVKMANLNFNMKNFWAKYLGDIRSGAEMEEQNTLFHERYNNTFYYTHKPSGIPYMIAPGKRLCGVSSPDWGTALVQLPWYQYEYYGDEEILSEYYEDMKYWTNYVATLGQDTARTNKYGKKTQHIIYQGLGDWCPPIYNSKDSTPVEFTSTAFHFLDVTIMEQVARILKKNEDVKRFTALKSAIFEEFVNEFYDKKNKTYGSQTANAMAIDLGLVPPGDEEEVSNAIVKNIVEKTHGFISTGIFGIPRIGSMLSRYGNAKHAYDIFTKKGENSFEWMIDSAKSTSLWETLPINSLSAKVAEGSSHNHPMQAGYDVCFYEDIGGIRPHPSGYGFKVIRFDPQFIDYLDWAKTSIESNYGTVSSSWHKNNKKVNWHIQIPPNSSGLVRLPDNKKVEVNGKQFNPNIYKKVIDVRGHQLYSFPSGFYEINF